MHKVGDEVLIKGEVVEVAKDVTYPIGVRLRCATVPMLFTEEELELSTKTYEMGLSDAWTLAKKIRVQPSNGGIPISELEEIFGTTFIDTIFKNNTYEEALAKIEAYEKEKEIKARSIVEHKSTGIFGIVTKLLDKEHVYVMWRDGSSDLYEKGNLKNTGRTAEGLTDLLRQIGE